MRVGCLGPQPLLAIALTAPAPITLFWFRRDLRLHDNHALFRALKDQGNVQPLFIFDRDILDKLEDVDDRRVSFIHDVISDLDAQIRSHGGSLWVEHGKPAEVIERITEQHPVKAVYVNSDHEPYGLARDKEVEDLLRAKGILMHSHLDHSIVAQSDVLKPDGNPYTVYTPYMRRWKERVRNSVIPAYASEDELAALAPAHEHTAIPSLDAMGFRNTAYTVPLARDPSVDLLRHYGDRRNFPGVEGTSRIGVHLRFGTVSVREMVRHAMRHSEVWLNELIWREFFMQILWHFPHVEQRAFRPAYDGITWRDDEASFLAWCEGRTGYPLVDAGMRELRATGFMHNRVRMVVASFLCKHLLIDWRWGEAWFARWLMDFELSSNNGNWQWASGSGCDAAPYFRVFNPSLQLQRFDPELVYVQRWVPEYGTSDQLQPIVEHRSARERAIATYKAALQ